MIEENTAQVTEHVEPAAEAVVEQSIARDYDKEARDIGWLPLEDFKGDPSKHKSAQKFVEDGENFIPILKANERKLRLELAKERSEFSERLARLDRVNKATTERLEAQHKAEFAQLKAQQREAAEVGDVAAFDRIEKQIDRLEPPKVADEPVSVDQQLEDAFQARNAWYGVDDDKTAIATHYSQKLARDSGNKLSLKENLDKVEIYMRERFPENKPAANGHAAVDGGGAFVAGGGSKPDPLSKLPNEARSQCIEDMKKFPKAYPSKESWIKVYEGKV